jgi:hypothetical protein
MPMGEGMARAPGAKMLQVKDGDHRFDMAAA